jgi:transcriptional regulator SbtR-like protein
MSPEPDFRSGSRDGSSCQPTPCRLDAPEHSPELYAYSFDRLTKAVGSLLRRAVKAGDIRSDIKPEELLRALVGMCYLHDQPGWQRSVLRLVDIFVDGLRAR